VCRRQNSEYSRAGARRLNARIRVVRPNLSALLPNY
jgi:hypothetical protein